MKQNNCRHCQKPRDACCNCNCQQRKRPADIVEIALIILSIFNKTLQVFLLILQSAHPVLPNIEYLNQALYSIGSGNIQLIFKFLSHIAKFLYLILI